VAIPAADGGKRRTPDQRGQGSNQFDSAQATRTAPGHQEENRRAEVDANRVEVKTNGSEVILEGTVRSWVEREEAERVAWSAPGVTKVEDRIIVSP
jgi:Flp pilus assembly secretin CpaC